jgi:hypothetical protein
MQGSRKRNYHQAFSSREISIDALDLAGPLEARGQERPLRGTFLAQEQDDLLVSPLGWQRILGRVRSFLSEVATIRIYVPPSRGMGHQNAVALAVGELRSLGYSGLIEILCENISAEKLRLLLPPMTNVRFTTPPMMPAQEGLAIGIIAAHDYLSKEMIQCLKERLNVKAWLLLQPYQWAGPFNPRGLIFADRPAKGLDLEALPFYSSYFEEFAPRSVEQRHQVNEQLAPFNLSTQHPRIDGLMEILLQVRQQRLDLMPIYGLHHPDILDFTPLIITNVISALEGLQREEKTKVPTVLLILSELKGNWKAKIQNQFLWQGNIGLPPQLIELLRILKRPQGGIILAECGALPRPAFVECFRSATLPVILEGAGSMSLALMLGKPFLLLKVKPPYHTPYPDRLSPDRARATPGWAQTVLRKRARFAPCEEDRLLETTAKLLLQRDPEGPRRLLECLQQLRNPQSKLSRYFYEVSWLSRSPANRQLVLGLDQMQKELSSPHD